jgi:hypothetical protein
MTYESVSKTQAVRAKYARMTFERKSMSTKTTIKRIALVAVSALGLGMVSTVSANAAGYTSGLTLGTSALTVVGTTETAGSSTAYGFFYVDSTNLTGTTSTAAPLESGESIKVTVTAAPTNQATTDLKITSVTNAATGTTTAFADSSISGDGDSDMTVAASDSKENPNSSFSTTAASNNESNRYWFAISTDTATAIGAGKYTLRIRLTNANSEVKDYTMTVKFVAAIADAGAVLTLAKNGSITTGVAYAYTANTSVTATLRDADGGRIQMGQALTGNRTGWAPTLNANMIAADGTVGESLTIVDTGVTARDYVNCGTGGAAACGTTPAGASAIAQTLSQAILAAGDGVYGVYDAGIAASAESLASVRIRVTNSAVSSSIVVPVIDAQTANVENTTVLLTASGTAVADTLARAVTDSSGTDSISYNLPLTATTAKLTIDTDSSVAGQYFPYAVTWSGSYASASVTPASAATGTLYTDASGKFTLDVTNSAPVNGGSVAVKLTGFDDSTHSLTITLNWQKAAISTLTITDPVDGVYAKTKATTVFTMIAKDQFGNALAGEQITPSLSTTSINYSATTKYAVITTGADGTATFSLTDATAAAADDADSITFTSVTDATKSDSYDLTYKATLPVVSTMSGFSSTTFAAASTVAARGTSIPTTGLGGASGAVLSLTRDLSKNLASFSDVAGDDMYAVRVRAVTSTGAAATGAAVTLTAPTGGWVLNSSGLPAASRTVAVDSSGDAYFQILATATGNLTFTATSGTASYAFVLGVADQDKDAGRFVTVTGAKTGVSNGAGVPVTVAVTDRYGNGVANVTLTVTASGVGAFMGGATSQSYTTDATGKYTFLATSYDAAGGEATYSATATNAGDAASVASYSGTHLIDSTVKAGNKAATATITFDSGTNPAADALDAANEATDAANAATDAANAAAEAADAATAAAQDAQAAVAALATSVASLIAGIKAQITTLTNLVIKIQKKVKA